MLRTLLQRWGIWSLLRGLSSYFLGKRGKRRVKAIRLWYGTRLKLLLGKGRHIPKMVRRHECRIFIDGQTSFRRIETLLKRARTSVAIQMFIWKNDEVGRHMASILVQLAERGVKVTIQKEAVGDMFEFSKDFLGTRESKDEPWHIFWTHPNITVRYERNDDHAKVYAIDDEVLVLTGMNIAEEYRDHLHDYLIELRGADFVRDYFAGNSETSDSSVRLVMNTEEKAWTRAAVMSMLRDATQYLIVEHCYISDGAVLDELIAASKRGTTVSVIVPHKTPFHHHANMAAVSRLLSEGSPKNMRVYRYPSMFHGKVILADGKKLLIGSANLMRSSLDEMGEASVLIERKPVLLWRMHQVLRSDILKSKRIPKARWKFLLSKVLMWLGL